MSESILALYVRLSLEDGDLNDEKLSSVSVENQKSHLWNYLVVNPSVKCGEVREFVDDGYTGTNFDRPALQEMLDLARNGQVKCIIVKDFSRFGRNYIEVGCYLEQILPSLNVRFISVDDRYDSFTNKGNVPGVDVVFKNIIHDYYSKELSNKVIQTKRNLAKKGLFLGGIPPFGYIKNPDNKYQLIIEPESAKTIRRIFAYVLDGKNMSEIARILNQEDVENPSQRLVRLGIRKKGEENKENSSVGWRADSISTILKNPVVIGSITNHKVERKALGKAELKLVQKKEHITVENMHEAIIEKEVYDKVQRMFSDKYENRKPKERSAREYPLSGTVKCGCCGRNLLIEGYNKKMYVCQYSRINSDIHNTYIKIEENILLGVLNNIISVMARLENTTTGDDIVVEYEKAEYEQTVVNINQKLKKKMLSEIYEEYVLGKISREKFLEEKEKIQEQFKVDIEITDVQKKKPANDVLSQLEQFTYKEDFSGITKSLVQMLVQDILVYSNHKVRINWKCADWVK